MLPSEFEYIYVVIFTQIKLPPQTEQIHSLEFSLVERYLYNKQHELCRTESSKVYIYVHMYMYIQYMCHLVGIVII